MRSNNKRAEILAAALQVVEQQGANHLTIDAVAKCAGFSKGGVLYHFNSKKALLSGMLDFLIESNTARIASRSSSDSLLAALLKEENQMTLTERRASMALVAAVAENPDLLEPARKHMKEVVEEIAAHSESKEDALLLFLANEGLRFLNLFELNPLSSSQTKQISRLLSERAAEL